MDSILQAIEKFDGKSVESFLKRYKKKKATQPIRWIASLNL